MRDVFPHCHLAEHDEIHAMVRRAQLDAMFAQPAERNHAPASKGRVVAICQICDRRSRPVKPNGQGEPDLWAMAQGWSEAPFPFDCKHDDGSVGSTFTCPACRARLDKGETLTLRNGRAKQRTRKVE